MPKMTKVLRFLITLIIALPVSYVLTIKALMLYLAWKQVESSPTVIPALWFVWTALFVGMFYGLNALLIRLKLT
jgi:hypothetical protein